MRAGWPLTHPHMPWHFLRARMLKKAKLNGGFSFRPRPRERKRGIGVRRVGQHALLPSPSLPRPHSHTRASMQSKSNLVWQMLDRPDKVETEERTLSFLNARDSALGLNLFSLDLYSGLPAQEWQRNFICYYRTFPFRRRIILLSKVLWKSGNTLMIV